MRPPQYLSNMGDEGVAAMRDELVPVVVAVRMKPNTENAPIAVQADPTNNTVTLLQQPNHGDPHAEVEGESYLKQQVRNMFLNRLLNYNLTKTSRFYFT